MLPPERKKASYWRQRWRVKPPKMVLLPTQYAPVTGTVFSFPIREQGDCSVQMKMNLPKENGQVPSSRKTNPPPPNELRCRPSSHIPSHYRACVESTLTVCTLRLLKDLSHREPPTCAPPSDTSPLVISLPRMPPAQQPTPEHSVVPFIHPRSSMCRSMSQSEVL